MVHGAAGSSGLVILRHAWSVICPQSFSPFVVQFERHKSSESRRDNGPHRRVETAVSDVAHCRPMDLHRRMFLCLTGRKSSPRIQMVEPGWEKPPGPRHGLFQSDRPSIPRGRPWPRRLKGEFRAIRAAVHAACSQAAEKATTPLEFRWRSRYENLSPTRHRCHRLLACSSLLGGTRGPCILKRRPVASRPPSPHGISCHEAAKLPGVI